MAFIKASIKDLLQPGIYKRIEEFEKNTIEIIALNGLEHKVWRKPAKKIYLEYLKDYYNLFK